MASVAAPLPAATFAPPLGRLLRLETEEEATGADGRVRRFQMTELVRFDREGDGYRLQMTLASAHAAADVSAPSARLFDLAMAPAQGRTVTILLDAAGRPVAVQKADALWEAMADAQDAVAARILADPALPPSMHGVVRAMAEAFRRTPAADREERLLRPAWALVGLAGRRSGDADDSVRLEHRDAAAAHYRITADGEDGRYTVDSASGLTVTSNVLRTLGESGATQRRRTRLIL